MYIAIEGVIGVGKTTLARLLQPAFESALVLEVFEENPFLSDFYSDRQRYAFQTQIFFLLSRYYQQRRSVPEILKRGESLITDYTFAKDALFARINLVGDELEMYYRVHDALAEKIPLPSLIVYLRADLEVLMQRIASRDRPYERNMEREYINQLIRAYDDFFINNQARNIGGNVTVLSLDTNELDYVRRVEDLRLVENRVRQTLKQVPFQASLPIIDDV
ncbi:MAG: deoxynucleoside kinase [Anaerolineales bacterium]